VSNSVGSRVRSVVAQRITLELAKFIAGRTTFIAMRGAFMHHQICGIVLLLFVGALRHSASAAGPDAEKPSGLVKVVMVGDIMLAEDEQTGQLIKRGEDPFKPFGKILSQADIAVGNLECVVAAKGTGVDKPYTFKAHPGVVPVLNAHFTGLSVANNHSLDYGRAAFVEQCARLEKAGLPYFGGGRDKATAHAPWIIEQNGIRIAFLGYCEVFLRSFQATDKKAGVAWSEDDDRVIADIQAAKKKAPVVIPFMHWGWEDQPPIERQKKLARKMIDAGATCVVGSHPHITQGAEYYQDHLIVYSLGNFVFNGFDTPETQTGWALRLTLDKDGVKEWDTVVARLDPNGVPLPDWKAKSPAGRRGNREIVERVPVRTMPAE